MTSSSGRGKASCDFGAQFVRKLQGSSGTIYGPNYIEVVRWSGQYKQAEQTDLTFATLFLY